MIDTIAEQEAIYQKCVYIKRNKRGTTVSCRLGLWLVQSPTEERVFLEAHHYWLQYYRDGEYDKFLSSIKEDGK